ncbi:antitoxin Xre/MbcA/ParS toxin-binding domain-containing protein [Nitrincola sp.]|uniref:antitoxin Xre/MbcA/ParS toxin-binding domain-containing protein n=1 Tax=Nitrincola sp. TaxID=1926584 RepID=UPI003A940BAC
MIRAARALCALTRGDQAWIKHFMRSQNKFTGGVPAIQVQTVQGLMRVATCLDAINSPSLTSPYQLKNQFLHL